MAFWAGQAVRNSTARAAPRVQIGPSREANLLTSRGSDATQLICAASPWILIGHDAGPKLATASSQRNSKDVGEYFRLDPMALIERTSVMPA